MAFACTTSEGRIVLDVRWDIDLIRNHHPVFMKRQLPAFTIQADGDGVSSGPLLFAADGKHFFPVPPMVDIPVGIIHDDIIGPRHIEIQVIVRIIDARII